MAWSDAARAAALEARRAHAHAKTEYKKSRPTVTIGRGGDSELDRAHIASNLRALRSGAMNAHPQMKAAMQRVYKDAVRSTAARNAMLHTIAKGSGMKVTQVISQINTALRRKG